MSIATEINRIKKNITNAYNACNSKGATIPDIQNSNNLAETINSIETGGIVPSGEISITKNGTYDVTNYASANVNITSGGSSNVVSGSFIPEENYISENQFFDIDLGFKPSAVFVYRKIWRTGIPSINATFKNNYFSYSICNTARSNKAVEKLINSSYITITDTGFKVVGNTIYYLVGNSEYIYIAVK